MNGFWQIFISDTTPTSLGNGVRFHYNPKTNKLQYRDPENGMWEDFPNIDLTPYLTKIEAASTYLTQGSAAATYLTITNAGEVYLSKTEASSTYLTASSADELFLTQADADNLYLNITTAVNTYAPKISPSFTGTVSLPSTTSIGNISATEISYLDGATESIQDQLDRKTQYVVVETSEDINALKDYQILADTTAGSLTVGLPEEVSVGDIIYIVDTTEMAFKEPIFVDGNGKNIHGKDEVFAINVAGATMVFMYVNDTMGWKVV